MNIDEILSILRKILENEGDIPTKLLISQQLIALTWQTRCHLIAMIQPLISMVIFASCHVYIFIKININIRIKKKSPKNEWGIPTKLPIS